MAGDSVTVPTQDCNEDYTGACCLLVRKHGSRRRKHLRIEVLIDADRLPDVSQLEWVILKDNIRDGRHYVNCMSPLPGMDGWILALHRYLMNPPKDKVVDHKNRQPSDNRVNNLRICTYAQNSWNTPPMKGCRSKYKGVRRNRTPDKYRLWAAAITLDGKDHLIGSFRTEEHAAYAYNVFAEKHFGEFAYLNQVRLDEQDIRNVMAVIDRMEKERERRKQSAGLPKAPPKLPWWLRPEPRPFANLDFGQKTE